MAPAPNAAQFGVLICPPMAPKLLLCANGDFGRSPIYGQLSDAHEYLRIFVTSYFCCAGLSLLVWPLS
jgi:hypothetical protein